MAWTRPKKPKQKAPADPVQDLAPLLSFFSGRHYNSNPSPTRKAAVPREVSNDPILRSLQQAQAQQEERPNSSHSHKTSRTKGHRQYDHPHHQNLDYDDEDEDAHETTPQRAVMQYEPPPPPPPPIVRPKPRVASYERPKPRLASYERPRARVQDQPVPRYMPSLQYVKAQPPRTSVSSWANATTPLEL